MCLVEVALEYVIYLCLTQLNTVTGVYCIVGGAYKYVFIIIYIFYIINVCMYYVAVPDSFYTSPIFYIP